MLDRTASSPSVLAERIRQVGVAWSAADEDAARAELVALSREAALLAKSYPLFPSVLAARQRIASERERTPRGGSS